MSITPEAVQPADVIAIERSGLRVGVARILRHAIFNGSLKPGDQIRENQMAAKIGVSRGPLREALLELEKEGLIEIKASRGAFVRIITGADVAETFTLRAPLETIALLCAKPRITPQILQNLETSLGDMAIVAKSGNMQRFIEAEFEFHQLIWAASGHSVLNDTLIRLCTPFFALAAMTYKPSPTGFSADGDCLESHRPLIEFLAGTTDLSASECQRRHFRIMREPLSELLKACPFYTVAVSEGQWFG